MGACAPKGAQEGHCGSASATLELRRRGVSLDGGFDDDLVLDGTFGGTIFVRERPERVVEVALQELVQENFEQD